MHIRKADIKIGKIRYQNLPYTYHQIISSFYSQSSNMLNQARLKVLKVREDHVRNVLEEARKRLGEVTRDQSKYGDILKSLILQGLYQVHYTLDKIPNNITLLR